MNSGIYKITNSITGDFYIGSTNNFNKRRWEHFNGLKKNKHCNKHLQYSFNKHKIDNFKFEIIAKCPKEYNIKFEQWFIDNLNPKYNKSRIAGCNAGYPVSDETRKKLSISSKNMIRTKEHYLKVAKSLTGKKASIETRMKQSSAKIGKNSGIHNNNYIGEINQYDKLGNYIKTWLTTKDICETLNIKKSALSMNLCGYNKTTKGLIFKYKIKCQE